MAAPDAVSRGKDALTVCNACRYCEQYCAMFPALERRRVLNAADLRYLANLCHNCGECLYACQFAPPHEYGINVPQALAAVRAESYERYCWPGPMAGAFRRNGPFTALALAVVMTALLILAAAGNGALTRETPPAEFYAVMPHGVMVALFGGVFLFVLVALGIGVSRFWMEQGRDSEPLQPMSLAVRDILTLRNLHASGPDCVSLEETRAPWRRWFHHCTFYGFLLCFASTSVAALYHAAFGWEAPYEYASVPVILGTMGGIGLLVGPAGQLVLRGRRDPSLARAEDHGPDAALILLLFLTSLTGIVLLVLREQSIMPALLLVHLGVVLALFLTLPYGKFVHGLYRAAALVRAAREGALK